MIYALIGLGLAGTASSAILAALWRSAKVSLVAEQSAHAATRAQLANAVTASEVSEAGRSGEERRLEAVIATLKEEIATLEAKKSAAPADLRSELERLSGG